VGEGGGGWGGGGGGGSARGIEEVITCMSNSEMPKGTPVQKVVKNY